MAPTALWSLNYTLCRWIVSLEKKQHFVVRRTVTNRLMGSQFSSALHGARTSRCQNVVVGYVTEVAMELKSEIASRFQDELGITFRCKLPRRCYPWCQLCGATVELMDWGLMASRVSTTTATIPSAFISLRFRFGHQTDGSLWPRETAGRYLYCVSGIFKTICVWSMPKTLDVSSSCTYRVAQSKISLR